MFQVFDLYYYHGLLLTDEKMRELGILVMNREQLNFYLQQNMVVVLYSNGRSISSNSDLFVNWMSQTYDYYYCLIDNNSLSLLDIIKCYGILYDHLPIVFYRDAELRDRRLDYINCYGIQPIITQQNYLDPKGIPPISSEMAKSNAIVESYLNQEKVLYKQLAPSNFLSYHVPQKEYF